MSQTLSTSHAADIASKSRFQFGANWLRFLTVLNEERIIEAENSLKAMLDLSSLEGKTFIDVGCGSGLFSLAAKRLGATVYSFDYDPDSVACAKTLKDRYFKNDANWHIEQGSILDADYINALGQFDIVYSWGVLHHTGDMQQALINAQKMAGPQGRLYISLYNDQGVLSRYWLTIKKTYLKLPSFLRFLIVVPMFIYFWLPKSLIDLVKHANPLHAWQQYKKKRGMSPIHDLIDWLGGYPFEVSKPEEILALFQTYQFELTKLKTCRGRHGCNEYLFIKKS